MRSATATIIAIYSTLLHFFGSDVHETPRDEEEDDGVNGDADVGRAPGRARNRVTEDSARELKHLGTRDDKEDETRDERRDELRLLLFAVAPASTVVE